MSTIMTDDYILDWKPITGLPVVLRVSIGASGTSGDIAILALVLEDDAIEAIIDALWEIGQSMLTRIALPREEGTRNKGPYTGLMEIRIGDYYGQRKINLPRLFVLTHKAGTSLQRALRELLQEARQFGHAAGGWYREPEQPV